VLVLVVDENLNGRLLLNPRCLHKEVDVHTGKEG